MPATKKGTPAAGRSPFFVSLQLTYDVISKFFAGGSVCEAGDHHLFFSVAACVERVGQPVRRGGEADVAKQHFRRLEYAGRVCVVRQPILYHPRRAAVDGLEHGVPVADVGASCGADSALDFGGFVGYDVSVQIRHDEDLKLISYGLVDKVCSHYIYVPVLRLDLRVPGRYFVAYL